VGKSIYSYIFPIVFGYSSQKDVGLALKTTLSEAGNINFIYAATAVVSLSSIGFEYIKSE